VANPHPSTQCGRSASWRADPTTVTAWITEAAEPERAARVDLQHATANALAPPVADDVLATIERFGSLTKTLEHPEPKDRAQLYDTLGVTATHDAIARSAVLEVAARVALTTCRRGDLRPEATPPLTRVVSLAS
jgi:hypothetical protein